MCRTLFGHLTAPLDIFKDRVLGDELCGLGGAGFDSWYETNGAGFDSLYETNVCQDVAMVFVVLGTLAVGCTHILFISCSEDKIFFTIYLLLF